MAMLSLIHDASSDRLLPLWEKVPEGRMRGVVPASQTPHPVLRATFSHKGRRKGCAPAKMEVHHGRH